MRVGDSAADCWSADTRPPSALISVSDLGAAGISCTIVNGRTEWFWAESAAVSSGPRPALDAAESSVGGPPGSALDVVVSSLPHGTGLKKAAEMLRKFYPAVDFDSRKLRASLAARESASSEAMTQPVQVHEPPAAVAARLAAHASTFVIRGSGGSGLGAFAARSIKRGERILAEEPLVRWTIRLGETVQTAALNRLVDAMSETDRGDYLGLCQNRIHGAEKTAYGIWLSNAYPTGSPLAASYDKLNGAAPSHEHDGACFAGACRFNHGCEPNAHAAWNHRLSMQTIHALRDIDHGEEICVSYLADVGTPRAGRIAKLYDSFGFTCECSACALTDAERTLSDQRRARIGVLGELIQQAVNGEMVPGGPQFLTRKKTNAIALVEERLALMDEEGVGGTGWDTMYAACAYSRSIGDKVAATKWASRAAENARLALGRDSDEFQKYAGYIGSRGGKKANK